MILPENILNKMSRKDRDEISRAAGSRNAGRTAEECRDAALSRCEKTAQKEIAAYLRQRGIEFINPPMRKKSVIPVGWPDFTLAFEGVPLAFEVKVWGQLPRKEQLDRHRAMRANGWVVYVVSSVMDVSEILKNEH